MLFAAGDLDTSFGGGDGVAEITPGRLYDTAIQSDGKIVGVGATGGQFPRSYVVARFNSNGTPDTSFGTGGRAVHDFPGENDVFEYVEIAPGGDIIAAGTALARYNSDGSLDRSFGGGDGHVEFMDSAGNTLRAGGLAVRPDGKILVAYSDPRTADPFHVVSRFNPDGSLDTSFGTGGTVTLPREAAPNDFAHASDLALAPGGKVVIAGTAVWRLKAGRATTSATTWRT